MALEPGSKLGSYEILAPLGAGGMGEVYRARDPRLGREVAIKVLPEGVAQNADRLHRFEREARAAGALNHPNILAVFDIGTHEAAPYMVCELLEGETLRESLRAGALPVRQAASCAVQIARGLGAAHEKGIIHRDLKPGNLFLTRDGRVKILDFGLVKLARPEPLTQSSDGTVTVDPPTESGVVMGTVGYVSPEQIRGHAVDHRTDIFAFGAVLYEMLSGRRAFRADTSAETLTAILKEDPPELSRLSRGIPPALARIAHRCLEKRPEQRFHSANDVAFALEALSEPSLPDAREDRASDTTSAPAPSPTARWRVLAPAVLGAAAFTAAVLVASLFGRTPGSLDTAPAPRVRFTIPFGDTESLQVYASASVAISSDGSRIAYAARRGTERSIYIRTLDELEGRAVPGTERGSTPIFSPDGEWIAFEAAGKLKKVSLKGGSPEFLANLAYFAGASWGPDDTIVYTPAFTGGLFAIPAQGGAPRRLTVPEKNHAHLWPEVLPDGRAVLFTLWRGGSYDHALVGLLSLETGKWKTLLEGGLYARYAPSGHLLFLRGDALFAAPFDLREQKVVGPSVHVLNGVLRDALDGGGQFAVSRTGTVVYAVGAAHPPRRALAWVDRSGRYSTITRTPGSYAAPRVSPDGNRIVVYQGEASLNLWVYGLAQGTLTRVSYGSDDHDATWSPDGTQLAFTSGRDGVHQAYVRSADGSGEDRQVTTGDHNHYLCDWSPDGRALAYVEFHPETGADLWVAELEGERPARAFLETPFWEKEATFSPDGRWLAYVSDASGEFEVYVRPFPGPGPRIPISIGGGEEPAWSRSGRELFYRSGSRMLSVSVSETPGFKAGRPEVLFEHLFHYAKPPTRSYDVAPDGRFVMVTEPEPDEATHELYVVLNWHHELLERVPIP